MSRNDPLPHTTFKQLPKCADFETEGHNPETCPLCFKASIKHTAQAPNEILNGLTFLEVDE